MAFVVEPVLAYVKAFNQRADRSEVRGAVLNCYDSIAIRKAKESFGLSAVLSWKS